ncbi:hypothetical protein [Streptomyces sp. NPDC059015]|uniref:hypothetical protein n=1 Tax=unclassified Streptomyces TaxID=2593676 RepID=UPI0036B10888
MIVAAVRFVPAPGDVPAIVRAMARLVRAAAGRGARLTVFGEPAVTGYDLGLLAAGPGCGPRPATRGRRRSGGLPCHRHRRGGQLRGARDGGSPAVASLVFGPDGELLARYDCEDGQVPLGAVA